MPCHRCGARQSDPGKGPSPWKRGVVAGEQVLVCPDCQRDPGWTDDLDRCAGCGSTMLVRTLGETSCRQCRAPTDPVPASPGAASHHATRDQSLSADVEAALRARFRLPS